jgi:hypothetical protein
MIHQHSSNLLAGGSIERR